MMLHPDEATAIDRGIDGAHFFGYSLGHFYCGGTHLVGSTHVWRSFGAERAEHGFAREIVHATPHPLARPLLQAAPGSPPPPHPPPPHTPLPHPPTLTPHTTP